VAQAKAAVTAFHARRIDAMALSPPSRFEKEKRHCRHARPDHDTSDQPKKEHGFQQAASPDNRSSPRSYANKTITDCSTLRRRPKCDDMMKMPAAHFGRREISATRLVHVARTSAGTR
jgi:hypothetical protein